jgi:dephospho-CoA kinase
MVGHGGAAGGSSRASYHASPAGVNRSVVGVGVIVIGLTGGIASGKSTVAAMLRELGAPIVDADLLARQVVEPGTPALAEIVDRFGAELLDGEGRLDRKQLAARVFADPTARAVLNSITHPRIAIASRAGLAELGAAGHEVAIYEAALLVENQVHRGLDGLIVVAVPEEVQVERVCRRDSIDAEAARARLAAQLPLAAKVAVADWTIDNGGSREETRVQVERVWREIQARARRPEGT